jgi:hypothetical protein
MLANLNWMNGLLLAGVAIVLLVVGRFVLALGRDKSAGEAAEITSGTVAAVLGAAFSVGAMGIINGLEILGSLAGFVGESPFLVSNGILGGLGALTAWLGWQVTISQWIGLTLLVPGVVLLLYEAEDAA